MLVVDDEDITRDVVGAMLDGAQVVVRTASSGAEALAIARAEHPELVLLDVSMPGVDGFSVCREIKADGSLADTRVVMLTGRSDSGSRRAAADAGADGYLVKPFSARELFSLVEGD